MPEYTQILSAAVTGGQTTILNQVILMAKGSLSAGKDRSTEKSLACEECYLAKKCCRESPGRKPCERCISRKITCHRRERKSVSQKGMVRGFYKKTLLRAQSNFHDAKKRRQKYCREKERKTGFRPCILQESDILNMFHVGPSSSGPDVPPGESSAEADRDTTVVVFGSTAAPNLDSSPIETANIGVGSPFNSSQPYFIQPEFHTIPEMIQFSPESRAILPSAGFAKSQSDGFPLDSEVDKFNMLNFSISSEVALTTSPSQLPLSGDVSGADFVVTNVESGGGLAIGNTGLQSSPASELVRRKDNLGGLPEIFQLQNANADVVPAEAALGFNSHLSLPLNPRRIISGMTTPVAWGDIPVYVPLSEQGTMLTTANILSEDEYQSLEELFMDHNG